jgi:hypothetical protein
MKESLNLQQICLLGIVLSLTLTQVNSQSKSLGETIFCGRNNDCIDTTFCCSTYSCVHPSTCLSGEKLFNDYCDYNFECASRCCNQ